MRKILTLFLLSIVMTANSRIITFDEAYKVASDYLEKKSVSSTRQNLHRGGMCNNEDSISPYYIFNMEDNEGFVIVAGDDRVQKILGYSPKGSFLQNHIPTQLKWLLDRYEKQMSNIPETASVHPSWKSNKRNTDSGEILLETAEWGQGAPYNSQCPIIDGVQAPTGCVATAIAIVMKYHNWPQTGYGMYDSYQDNIYHESSESGAFSFNWDGHPFSWDSESVDDFPEDMAQNIYLIGKTFRTAYYMYDSYSDDVYRIGPKLHAFFNYSKDCQTINRNNCDRVDWYGIIRAQIDAGYPLIYFGTQEDKAHAFVCDGYNDSLFHFNFGWDGLFNGYYALDISDTDVQPFHDEEGMVINIIPDRHDDKCLLFTDPGYIWEYRLPELQTGEFYIIKHQNTQEDIWSSNGFTLYAPIAFNGKIGLALADRAGKIKKIVDSFDISNDFFRRKFEFSNFSMEGMVESDSLSIVYKQEGSEDWERVCGTLEAPSTISVDKGTVYVEIDWNVDSKISITQDTVYDCPPYRVLDLEKGLPNKLLKNQKYWFKATMPQGYKGRIVQSDSLGNSDYHTYYIYENPKELNFCVSTASSRAITIEKYQPDEELEVDIDNQDDSYFDYWPLDEMASLKSLTVKDNIGAWEFLFISNFCCGLEILDLSQANYYPSDCISYGCLHFLNYLERFYFPKNLERIMGGYTCSNLHQLKVIALPEKIKAIDGAFWDGISPHLIICPNPIPPILENGPVFRTEYLNMTSGYVGNSKLLVPKGSRQTYLETPEWNKFAEIEEYDGDWQSQVDEFMNKNRVTATAISVTPSSISGEVGEKFSLTANVEPWNVVNMPVEWSSSGDEAIVDEEGNVEILKPGSCIITVRTTDGSDLSAKCAVNDLINDGIIDAFEEDAKYDIYDMNGLMIKKQASREDIRRLPTGFYMIGKVKVYKK